jgi:Arc/MetJ-type ribon-helix-helix transcriptional regulator
VEAYLAAFGANADALTLLIWFATDTRQPALAERIAALAASRQFPAARFTLASVQLKLAERDYPGASELARAALQTDLTGQEYTAALLEALRAIALFGLKENAHAQSLLDALLDKFRVRASDALLLARYLRDMKQLEPARRVLGRAVQADPLNQPALAELIRLDAAAGDRAAIGQHLPALLALRRHSRAALEDVLRHLNDPGDAPLRAQILAALARSP